LGVEELIRRNLPNLYEDAFAGTVVGGDQDLCIEVFRDLGDGAWATWIIRDHAGFTHICDSVFEQCENVRAVVGAEAIAGAKVLINPHSHDKIVASIAARTPETVPIRRFAEGVGVSQLLLRIVRDVS
jgi:hypothetical protein